MKRIRLILIISLLFAFVSYTKGQEMQQIMTVYKNGGIFHIAKLSITDSIVFPKFSINDDVWTYFLTSGRRDSVLWATCNVDTPGTFAAHPEDAGMFFQWYNLVGWSSTDPLVNHEGGTDWKDSIPPTPNNNLKDPCPQGWRLPTQNELNSLINSGSFFGEVNGVPGRFFGGGDKRVFFPAAGYRNANLNPPGNGELKGVGNFGRYWSMAPINNTAGTTYALNFDSTTASLVGYTRNFGYSARCVKNNNN